MRDGDDLEQTGDSGRAGKWSVSRYIFKVEPIGLPDELDIGYERKTECKSFWCEYLNE